MGSIDPGGYGDDQVIAALFVIFVLVDGVVRGSMAEWGGPGRAWLVAALVATWIVWLWRSLVKLEWPAAALIGVMAAFTISEAYHNLGGVGWSAWMIVSGMYWAQ